MASSNRHIELSHFLRVSLISCLDTVLSISSLSPEHIIPGELRTNSISFFSTEIHQSINLFVKKYNTHWTGHQGRMQPPLTGAHKNTVSKSNK